MKSLIDGDAIEENGEMTCHGWANFETNSPSPGPPTASTHTVSKKNEDDVDKTEDEVNEFDDWQNFKADQLSKSSHHFRKLSVHVMNSCFKTSGEASCLDENERLPFCDQSLYKRNLGSSRCAVSCPLIQLTLQKIILCDNEAPNTRQQLQLDLPAECDGFDWDSEASPTRDSISPILFRPGLQESPIDVDFDHIRASLGLAMLSESELNVMSQEMERKFTHLSESLVIHLQLRDRLVTELTVKNKFISAMLRVTSLQHSNIGTSTGGINGTGRPRSMSMKNKSAVERLNGKGKYLFSIVPYCPPENNIWSVNTLLALIEILNAIAEDSDNVPTLVADYLKAEVLR